MAEFLFIATIPEAGRRPALLRATNRPGWGRFTHPMQTLVEPTGADGLLAVEDIREHYDRLSPLYRLFWGEHIHHGYWEGGESAHEAQRKLCQVLSGRANITGGEHVLDIGCGLGGSALWLAQQHGCRVQGISISPRQVAAASKEARKRKLDALVTFAVQDANHLEQFAGTYDIAWIIECSEHVFDKPRFIEACARLLKPGGRLAICAWLAGAGLSANQSANVQEVLRGMLCPSFGTKADYLSWMESSGLEVLTAEDITRHVTRTWELCRPVLGNRVVQAMLAAGDVKLRAFADSFGAIHQAYQTGAMEYGIFVAQKPLPR